MLYVNYILMKLEGNKDYPHRSVWVLSNLLYAQIEHKGGGRANLLSLLELGHPPSPALRHWRSRFLALRIKSTTHKRKN